MHCPYLHVSLCLYLNLMILIINIANVFERSQVHEEDIENIRSLEERLMDNNNGVYGLVL